MCKSLFQFKFAKWLFKFFQYLFLFQHFSNCFQSVLRCSSKPKMSRARKMWLIPFNLFSPSYQRCDFLIKMCSLKTWQLQCRCSEKKYVISTGTATWAFMCIKSDLFKTLPLTRAVWLQIMFSPHFLLGSIKSRRSCFTLLSLQKSCEMQPVMLFTSFSGLVQ